ncbi:MAG: hypothetical protein ABJM22_01360, partial [Balneola sp.]
MKYFDTKILFLVLAFIGFSYSGYAQTDQNGNVDIIEYLSLDKDMYSVDKQLNNLNLLKRNSLIDAFNPVDEIWDKIAWANPKVNFRPSGSFISIGDINGDGIDDLAKRFFSVSDERDSDISSQVNKSLIYYGGESLSTDFDQLIYSGVYPLGG